MARMIPPVIGDDTSSPGEREVFALLAEAPGTEGWIVLHSLEVARHQNRVAGEIDFVVIVPGFGVLCLEVKAHHSVRRDSSGMWHLGSDPPTARSPFRQASEAMHSIRERVGHDPSLRPVLFWSGVCFTSASFQLANPAEWHPWQVIDAPALASRPIKDLVCGLLSNARLHAVSHGAGWLAAGAPTAEQCAAILRSLRPSFEFAVSPKQRRRALDAELLTYTEDQFAALDGMHANERAVFEGPAGTGKTLLAIEEARRAAARGEKTLLLCFNRLLGAWIREQTSSVPGLAAGSFHAEILRISGLGVPERAGATFWSHTLPLGALRVLLEAPEPCADTLIVDEAQDLLSAEYLDVFDALLRGGLRGGRWRLFGDFTRQAIFTGEALDWRALITDRTGTPPPVFSLRDNCRNPPRVADYVRRLSGLEHGYRRVLRPDSRKDPKTLYYDEATEQASLLAGVLEQLRRDGYAGRDIVILSPRAAGCAAEQVGPPWRDQLRRLDGAAARGGISYCTVHAFKGLEAPAVVLTDIDSVSGPLAESLFYVAASRATDCLFVLASTSVQPAFIERVIRPIAKEPR